MKINLLIVLMLLMFFSGCRSQRPVSPSVTCKPQCTLDVPRIVFLSTEHNFGKVDAGSQNTCTFDFINDGGKDLVIESVYASCGCAASKIKDTVIKPGQVSEIAINFHAGYSGKTRKQITVFTNDPNKENLGGQES